MPEDLNPAYRAFNLSETKFGAAWDFPPPLLDLPAHLLESGQSINIRGKAMLKRMILMLVVLLAVIGGLAFIKFRQVKTAMAAFASAPVPKTAVTTLIAK